MSLAPPMPIPAPAALPPPAGDAPPGAPPGAPPFGNALDSEMARTAPAEGQNRSPGNDGGGQSETRADHGRRDRVDGAEAGLPAPVTAAAAQVSTSSQTRGTAAGTREAATHGAANPDQPVPGEASGDAGAVRASAVPAGQAGSPAGPGPGADAAGLVPGEAAPAESVPAGSGTADGAPGIPASTGTLAPQLATQELTTTPPLRAAAGQDAREVGERRATQDAALGVLGKAPRGPLRGDAEAQPAQDPAETATAGARALNGSAQAPVPASKSAASQVSGGPRAHAVQQASPATGGSEASSDQPSRGEQQRSGLPPTGVAERSAPARHAREAGTSVVTSRGEDAAGPSTSSAAGASSPTALPAQQGPAASPATAATGAQELTARAEPGEMIDTIQATIELAARHGATQARIALQPEELGEITIHLSQSAEGILARVTAATPAAAQALAAGRGELHQSLSSLGTTLLRLDIGMFEGREGQRREIGGEGSSGRAAAAPTEEDESIAAAEGASRAAAPASTPLGALVDVLA